jgi:hypothetical protein
VTHILPGSTRHGHRGSPGRAIDLAASSVGLQLEVTVHNGLHCGGECAMADCSEYTGSDHFLITGTIPAFAPYRVEDGGADATRYPKEWLQEDTWREVLAKVRPQLLSFAAAFGDAADLLGVAPREAPMVTRRWLGDLAGVCLEAIAALGREVFGRGSVYRPRQSAAAPSRKVDASLDLSAVAPTLAAGVGGEGELDSHAAERICKDLCEAVQAGAQEADLMAKAYRWLRGGEPRPRSRMYLDGALLTERETTARWGELLQEQSTWADGHDAEFEERLVSRVRHRLGHAAAETGLGPWDHEVAPGEVAVVTHGWDASDAMPPDRTPRLVYQLRDPGWDPATWAVQRLCGPGGLAVRPARWRRSALGTKYKDGDPMLQDNFRLLLIKAQQGLLQEHILFSRGRDGLWDSLQPEQSGYRYSTDNPHLVAHELLADRQAQGLPTTLLPADMKKAFPRTWREALLDEASTDLAAEGRPGVPLRGGALVAVAECLRWDEVVVGIGATSLVEVQLQGVPEGGVLGPWLYTKLPDVLIRRLRAAGCGVRMGTQVPPTWQGCRWPVGGRVTPTRAAHLETMLEAGGAGLPSRDTLERNQDLSADALEALERVGTAAWQAAEPPSQRLACLFHCDDPFFFAPTVGGMRQVMPHIEQWSGEYKQEEHVTDKKLALGLAGRAALDRAEYARDPLRLRAEPRSVPAPLALREEKKWLGALWRGDLDFEPQVRAQMRSANVEMIKLAGLVGAGFVLPIAIAAFEGKVDSKLQHARWLHVLPDSAAQLLDQQFSNWARQLLGVPAWASGDVARLELGWGLSGFARSICAAARQRAAFWGDTGLAGHYFRRGHSSAGRTWAKVSLQVLRTWGVPDFPECMGPTGEPASKERYKKVVKELLQARCKARWQEGLRRRTEPLPYTLYVVAPATVHRELLQAEWAWGELRHVRGWCRLRTQAVQLAELDGVPSRATHARCIFCAASIAGAEYHHALAECPVWDGPRAALAASNRVGAGPRRVLDLVLAVLRPGDAGAAASRSFAAAIDDAASEYWARLGKWH